MMARTVTLADIARLYELFPNVDKRKFVSSFVCILDYDKDDVFTGWLSKLADGKKVTLVLNSWGPCQFLNDNKCFVHTHRPWMCRMFPFWFNPSLTVREQARLYCESLKARPHPLPHTWLEECAKAATRERRETLDFFKSASGKTLDDFVDAVLDAVIASRPLALENLELFKSAESSDDSLK